VPSWQVGIQERGAAEALRELDDGLAERGAGRDIVNTVPWNGERLTAELVLKIVLGAVNRRLDRKKANMNERH
jgi:hypothetical protein